jgi:hypothetical protein
MNGVGSSDFLELEGGCSHRPQLDRREDSHILADAHQIDDAAGCGPVAIRLWALLRLVRHGGRQGRFPSPARREPSSARGFDRRLIVFEDSRPPKTVLSRDGGTATVLAKTMFKGPR